LLVFDFEEFAEGAITPRSISITQLLQIFIHSTMPCNELVVY
jgi:hypothetical protein